MDIYYQQSGKRGEGDFPKTLGDRDGKLRTFSLSDLEDRGAVMSPSERQQAREAGDFQLWGVPSGARRALKNLARGDLFLLIGQLSPHALEYARFYFAGKVCFVLGEEQRELSDSLWGDGAFPIVFGMQGNIVDYSWMNFANDFNFRPGYYVAGQVMRVLPTRIPSSPYRTAENFAQALGVWGAFGQEAGSDQLGFEEGGRSLQSHLELERSSALVDAFKASLSNFACSICEFDFEASYAELGKGYIEAHHVDPLHAGGLRKSSVDDLIAVCANCHRMLHRGWPLTTPADLRARFFRA